MKKLSLNEHRDRTEKVTAGMPQSIPWTVHNRMLELIEEVGELANAIQTEEGFKTKKRKKADLVDSICDVLFEVFNIAAHYKVDLDKEYPKVLKMIDDRRKSGEFDY